VVEGVVDMRIMLATLCLNEMEFLQKLYDQHKDWPGLMSWVFVESADRVYAKVNPTLVSPQGLSVDGTSDFLRDLAASDPRVLYIPHGFSEHEDPALGKIDSRQQYLTSAEKIRPESFIVLDADEFYCRKDQQLVNDTMKREPTGIRDFSFQFTHIWHPQSISDEMRHAKGFRWHAGIRYTHNHQRPTWSNWDGRIKFFDEPHCIHMAFATDPALRKAKHDYYIARGEGGDSKRYWYVLSRTSFETWKPGDRLLRGAKVYEYKGPIPEVFQTSCVSV
jgi:hypothetical protein